MIQSAIVAAPARAESPDSYYCDSADVSHAAERIAHLVCQIDELRKMNCRLEKLNVALVMDNARYHRYFRTSLFHRMAAKWNRIVLRWPRLQRAIRFVHYWSKMVARRPTRNERYSLAELFPSPEPEEDRR